MRCLISIVDRESPTYPLHNKFMNTGVYPRIIDDDEHLIATQVMWVHLCSSKGLMNPAIVVDLVRLGFLIWDSDYLHNNIRPVCFCIFRRCAVVVLIW